MIRYIPFLKAKRGELNAMGELAPGVKQAICPFFDFPRAKPDYDMEDYAATARSIARGLRRHWGADAEFYFDDLDISQTLEVEGEHQYAYVLMALEGLQVIPVVALDRISNSDAVVRLKRNGAISSAIVAFRAELVDFEDFDAKKDQIEDDLATVFKEFKSIDLIFDCRLCGAMDASTTAQQIAAFSRKFCATYSVRRVAVTGSCIPPSIRDVVGTDDSTTLSRRELEIIAKARDLVDIDLITGDYATVSPFYHDMQFDKKLFQKVTAPRLVYSFDHSHYIARGTSLALGGQRQYVGLTSGLCQQGFFRSGYSAGDDYFHEKSQSIGSNATNGTVVKPSVVAHITYMVLGAKL